MSARQHISKKSSTDSDISLHKSLQSRAFATQRETDTNAPLTQQDIENQQYEQDKIEATRLEIQAKYKVITPQGQERLTFLQAKKADEWHRRLGNASKFGHSLANISMRPRTSLQPAIQAQLTIGAPGDKYEQEADRVAAQVVNQINAPVSQQPNQNLQREEMSEEEDELMMKPEISNIQREALPEEEVDLQRKPIIQLQAGDGGMAAPASLESSIQQARSGGQPLADNVRKPMERAFGADFSGVKVHADSQADQLNQSIQARAFTTGQDVFFRQGEYNPGTGGGQELLAHELTHVVQQNGGAVQREQLQRMDQEAEAPEITVTNYEQGLLNNGPIFEHISFSDGSKWSTKIVSSGPYKGKHVYLDIREGLHQGQGYSVKDQDGYKAQDVKNWLLGIHPDLNNHWKAYRQKATA